MNEGEGKSTFGLGDLADLIKARAGANADQSYTRSLLEKGPARVARKFGEEAVELVIATVEGDKRPIIGESADVLYHLLVLLEASGIGLSEVLAELERRTAQSGHQEKASRPVDGG